jgi:hypothetical protein
MQLGGKGMKLGYKILDVYIGLAFVGAILGGTGVGLYVLLSNIVNNMSTFGAAGIWAVGGIIYLVFAIWVFTEVLHLFSGGGGKKSY